MDTAVNPQTNFGGLGVPLQTSVETIRKKVLAFHAKMNQIAQFLEKNGAPEELRIDPEEVFLQFYIDKPAITRLINISMQENFAQFGVFFALENPEDQKPPEETSTSFGRPTACFLGLDSNNNILGCHFPKIPVGSNILQVIDGEDTWPPPPPPGAAEEGAEQEPEPEAQNQFTLYTNEVTLDTYFNTAVTVKLNGK